ncbi:MAG: 50S ribosomal protein L4 [Pseudomonadota bacterium]|nr:50S ribosomal protein L4 [Pseudomonadota bacterium]
MKLSVLDKNNKVKEEIEINDAIFSIEPRSDIMSRVVHWQLSKRQQGTHSTKSRSFVSGSTKKIVKQKGSGGARHGSKRGAQFRGGGIIFGPVPHSHAYSLPKKVRALGLRMALSAKALSGNLTILESFEMDNAKTKEALKRFSNLGTHSALFIDGESVNPGLSLAVSNVIGMDALPQIGANVYDILRKEKLVISVAGIRALEERLK